MAGLWVPGVCIFYASAVRKCRGDVVDRYERLTHTVQKARATEAQFLEHLILRAEVIWSF